MCLIATSHSKSHSIQSISMGLLHLIFISTFFFFYVFHFAPIELMCLTDLLNKFWCSGGCREILRCLVPNGWKFREALKITDSLDAFFDWKKVFLYRVRTQREPNGLSDLYSFGDKLLSRGCWLRCVTGHMHVLDAQLLSWQLPLSTRPSLSLDEVKSQNKLSYFPVSPKWKHLLSQAPCGTAIS